MAFWAPGWLPQAAQRERIFANLFVKAVVPVYYLWIGDSIHFVEGFRIYGGRFKWALEGWKKTLVIETDVARMSVSPYSCNVWILYLYFLACANHSRTLWLLLYFLIEPVHPSAMASLIVGFYIFLFL